MSELLFAFAMYFIGLATGAVGVITLTIYLGKRAMDKKSGDPEKVGAKAINDRLRRVKAITQEQLDLQGAVSGPQKNALHGKYKNGAIGRIKELETEKENLLKSIITDGFDPEITVMGGDGVVTTQKLSQFLADAGIIIEPAKETPTKQMGKFTVHKGGKDDGNTVH